MVIRTDIFRKFTLGAPVYYTRDNRQQGMQNGRNLYYPTMLGVVGQ